jgi:hypothetical protein
VRREVIRLLYTESDTGSSPVSGTKIMKLFEATIRVNGKEFKDRVGADNAQEAMKLLQQRHGPRAVPYMPKMIPS